MVVNTVIDVGSSRKARISPSIGRTMPVNLSGKALKDHERIMEKKSAEIKLRADLEAAMNALATANKDIVRLNADIDALRKENKMLNDQISASKQKKQKKQKDQVQEESKSDGQEPDKAQD